MLTGDLEKAPTDEGYRCTISRRAKRIPGVPNEPDGLIGFGASASAASVPLPGFGLRYLTPGLPASVPDTHKVFGGNWLGPDWDRNGASVCS